MSSLHTTEKSFKQEKLEKEAERDEETFIERCPHDPENPYAQISNALIRDKSISPECRHLIIYLLSNKDKFRISVKKLTKDFADWFSRKRVFKIINEAIDAGYMKREQERKERGRWQRTKYFVSEFAKFKKCLPSSQIRDPVNFPVEELLQEEDYYEEKELKQEKPVATAPDIFPSLDPPKPREKEQRSDAELEFEKYFFERLRQNKPNAIPKKLSKRQYSVIKTIVGIRTPDEIKKALEWALKHNFWSSVILGPESLLKNLDRIEIQMNSNPNGRKYEAIKANEEKSRKILEVSKIILDEKKGIRVEVKDDAIEFCTITRSLRYEFTDPNFDIKVDLILKKWGLWECFVQK